MESHTNMKKERYRFDHELGLVPVEPVEVKMYINGDCISPTSLSLTERLWKQKEDSLPLNELSSETSKPPTQTSESCSSLEPTTNSTSIKMSDTQTGVNKMDSNTESSDFRPVFSETDRPVNLETVIYYWPNALKALAELNRQGNLQHYGNADKIRWKWKVSSNHVGKMLNHLIDNGTVDSDGIRHSTKVAWRALAMLETELINAGATPGRYRIDDDE